MLGRYTLLHVLLKCWEHALTKRRACGKGLIPKKTFTIHAVSNIEDTSKGFEPLIAFDWIIDSDY